MPISPLHQMALLQPLSPAYKDAGNEVNYAQLSQNVQDLATQLEAQGLKAGHRLACISHNNPMLLILYWACIDKGILFCPISPRFAPQQLADLLTEHQHTAYWAPTALALETHARIIALDFHRQSNSHHRPPQLNFDAPCNAILTSGSTGLPKAAVHSLNNHIASAQGAHSLISLNLGDAWLLSLPLFHIGGLAIINRCALAGACVVFSDQNHDLPQQIIRDQLTHLSLVSTQLIRLLKQNPSSLQHIKTLLLGGGAIASPLLDQLSALGINAYTSYGMTEMASQITTGKAQADASSGNLLPGRELKIENEVIFVKGATLFLGYLDKELGIRPAVDEQGWFCTQDLGFWNDKGKLQIIGRLDNMFICGGENVQPEEIETALKQHPKIDDAIVFAIKDVEFGLLPAAMIKGLRPSSSDLTEFLADKIARFKRPRQYFDWPEVNTVSLKVPRKQMIEKVKATNNLE